MTVLVTGGGGFLGRAVCARLVERGVAVRAVQRTESPALRALGVEQRLGDVRSRDDVQAAVSGVSAVVHCAAKAGAWGKPTEFEEINVGGTLNVLDACRHHGVDRLVHTSSPSVVHDGSDLEGVDESAPYARRFSAAYPRTKAAAERHVLATDSPELATVVLRPHLIWGPGDPHFLPRLTARARSGRLRHPGARSRTIDTVHVDNAAEAHVLALERLHPGSPIAGRVYFITQDEPMPADEMINALLTACGLPPEHRRVPVWLVRLAGAVVESTFRALRLRAEPPLTRFLAEHLSTAHWFDITAARADLGYRPLVSTGDGLADLARAHAADLEGAP